MERKLPISVIERAARYVATMPHAVSGSGGHTATFKVAVALVHGFALSEEEALPILCAYSERCDPPWSERELRHKLESARDASNHPMPRGYLLGNAHAPSQAPAISAKPLSLRKVTWQERLAEVTSEAVLTRAERAPRDLVKTAVHLFHGRVLPDDAPDENALNDEMQKRLQTIEAILDLKDGRGRVAFTGSQIESCRIGLRGFAGSHPEVDVMLKRLAGAKKVALDA